MDGKKLLSWLILSWVSLATVAHAHDDSPGVDPAPYDAAVFAKLPLINGPKLSPNGQRILFSTQSGARKFVAFRGVTDSKLNPIPMPDRFYLNWYRWAGNNRILISVSRNVLWNDSEARRSYLLAVDTQTLKPVFIGKNQQGLDGDNLLYVDPGGEWALVSIQRRNASYYPAVYRADLATGKVVLVQPAAYSIWDWYVDTRGSVRMGISYDRTGWTLHYRATDTGSFKKLATVPYDDEKASKLIGDIRIIGGTDKGYVLAADANGRYAIHAYNYVTQTVGELLYGHPEYDILDFDISPNGSLSAAYFTDDRPRVHWFDPAQQQVQDAIDKALGDRHGALVSRSRDGAIKIVHVGGSNDPGSYYIYDEAVGVMAVFARSNEAIQPARLSPSKYISYQARDGLKIHANLTLPKGRDPKGLPLIILPHGGPYGIRDALGYEVEVQFLASRGYAVLQPNFRGSGGYGEAHLKAGEGAIGRQMQDDLDDGMDWLVAKDIADPARVCVVGSSYGGYAALWAVTRNPDRYRCAASFAGVTDWDQMLKYDARFFTRSGIRKWRGVIQGNEDFDLDTVSPLKYAMHLTRPVLLAQGMEDTIVPPRQAKIYVAALESAKKDFEYVPYEKEGHGFGDPANLADWLKKLEAFLAKHNPV